MHLSFIFSNKLDSIQMVLAVKKTPKPLKIKQKNKKLPNNKITLYRHFMSFNRN